MNSALQKELSRIQQLYQTGQIDSARNVCRKAIKRFNKKVEPCLLLAQLEQAQGKTSSMLYALDQALQRAPTNTKLRADYGDAAMSAGQYGEAAKIYRAGIKLQPQQPAWKLRLAMALQEMPEHLSEAVTIYRQLVKATPEEATLHYNLGTALKRQHDFVATKDAYQQAVRLSPQDADMHFSLCNLLIELEDFEEAVLAIETLLVLKPDFSQAYEWLYYAHKKLGQYQKSLLAAERFVEITGHTVASLGSLASAQIAVAEYALAVKHCDMALDIEPKNRRVLADKTIALSADGKKEQAQQLFNFDHLVQVTQIAVPEGYSDITHFNTNIIEHVQQHPVIHFDGLSHSCHKGATSNEVFSAPLGPAKALMSSVESAVISYRKSLSELIDQDRQHPWLSQLPDQELLAVSG